MSVTQIFEGQGGSQETATQEALASMNNMLELLQPALSRFKVVEIRGEVRFLPGIGHGIYHWLVKVELEIP